MWVYFVYVIDIDFMHDYIKVTHKSISCHFEIIKMCVLACLSYARSRQIGIHAHIARI